MPLDNGGGIEETLGRADLLVLSETTGLEKCLHDIERSSEARSKGTSKTTGHAVGERVIFLLGVHKLGEGLVGDKLCGSEGNSHAEGGRVGEVEGLETLSAVEGFGALHQALVNGSVDLHSLLDHYFDISAYVRTSARKVIFEHSPSNGFISASLAIVADAPLRAKFKNQSVMRNSHFPFVRKKETTYQQREGDVHRPHYHQPSPSQSHMFQSTPRVPDLNILKSATDIPVRVQWMKNLPAPTITLETPFHSVRQPSIR